MAKTKISEFSATPANNTDIDSINIAEGCAPSGINDAIRELMAQLKDWQAGTSNDPMVIGTTGSLTLNQGTANGVTYLNGSKVLTSGSALVFDGTNLGVGTTPTVFGAGYSTLTVQGSTTGFVQASNGTIITEVGTFGGIGYTGTRSNHSYGFVVSGSEQMRLTSTGLGIGTSSPAVKLDVTGLIRSNATANGGGQVTIAKSGTTVGVLCGSGNVIGSAATDLALYAETGNAVSIFTNGSATARATFDTSGNIGIGTTAPAGKLDVRAGTGATLLVTADATNLLALNNYNATSGFQDLKYVGSTHQFFTGTAGGGSVSERARILSDGDFLFGTTSSPFSSGVGSAFSVQSNGRAVLVMRTNSTSTSTLCDFGNPNSTIGTIQVSGTSTSFNTSSDYRLKEDVQPMTGALAKVVQLKPVTYKWKTDGTDGQGFIAHELAEVVPQCVTGEKDAINADGKPIHQGVDTSFLVATLTAAIQEQQAIIESLKARLDAANL